MALDLTGATPVITNPHGTINITNIQALEQAICTYIDTHDPDGTTPRAAGNYTAGNVMRPQEIRNIMATIVFLFAHNGTNPKTSYPPTQANNLARGTSPAQAWNIQVFLPLFAANNVTYREYARNNAQFVFNYGKANGIEWRLGRKHGIDQKYGYCGFDFSIYATGLNTHERAAADATFQVALARAQSGGENVTNAVEITKGRIPSSSRSIMF